MTPAIPGVRGTTPTGLPYPEDTDPVMAGAQAIKALAQAVEQNIIGGAPQSVYEGLRKLGATAPIAWTYDPVFGGVIGSGSNYTPTNNRLQMVAVTVPHAYTCTGVMMVTDTVGTGFPGSVYNGFGLWQYAPNGDATFLRDTGPSNGAHWTVAGLNARPWASPIQLAAGAVYLVGFTQQSTGTLAVMRGLSGTQANAGLASGGPFWRSGAVTAPGSTQASVMKTWPSGSLIADNRVPLLVLY